MTTRHRTLPNSLKSVRTRHNQISESTGTLQTAKSSARSSARSVGAYAQVWERQEYVKRRLRRLFIYPAIYAVMTIPLFVEHCWLFFKDAHPPFALSTIAAIFTAAQCAVDCMIFMLQEKPWTRMKKPSSVPSTGQILRPKRVQSDGMEAAPVEKQVTLDEVKDMRQWWDQEVYSTGSGRSIASTRSEAS